MEFLAIEVRALSSSTFHADMKVEWWKQRSRCNEESEKKRIGKMKYRRILGSEVPHDPHVEYEGNPPRQKLGS